MFVHSDVESISKIVKELALLIDNNKLIPFFGAGFTSGSKTGFNKVVPDAQKLVQIFIDEILKCSPDYSPSDFEDESETDLQSISAMYFQAVPSHRIEDQLKQYFTKVKLDNKSKENFLNIDWKAIFTLNIDDAIESNSNRHTIAFPFCQLSIKHIKDYPIVFKLHGDLKHNLIHEKTASQESGFTASSVIFCESSYLKSILDKSDKSNMSMLNIFSTYYKEHSFIFIGCSLKDETDIKAILELESKDIKETSKIIKRFYVSSKAPTAIRKSNFQSSFGITDWIVVEHDKMNDFYEQIFQELKRIGYYDKKEKPILEVSTISRLEKENKDNKKIICGISKQTSSNIINANYSIPFFVIDRDVKQEAIDRILNNNITIIIGKRISGKSTFVLSILHSLAANKKVFYIPSEVSLDLVYFNEIISSLPPSSVIAFDSNTLSDSHIVVLAELSVLHEKNISVILVFNASNRLELTFAKNHLKQSKAIVEIGDKFSEMELTAINDRLNMLGFPKFQPNDNILSNIFRVKTSATFGAEFASIKARAVNKDEWYTKEYIIGSLLILLTTGKLYTSTFNILYGNLLLLDSLLSNMEPYLEKEFTISFEQDSYSGYKITANCKICLLSMLENAIEEKHLTYDSLSDSIVKITSKLQKTAHSKIYKQIILFDNLNQIFSISGRQQGVRFLIYKVYEALENTLHNETDYWLQRAKSYLYLAHDNEKEVMHGIQYAEKALMDFSGHKIKEGQSLFVLAMLFGKLVRIQNYSKIENVYRSIDLYTEALTETKWNKDYIDSILRRKSHINDLRSLCTSNVKKLLKQGYGAKIDKLFNKLFQAAR